MFRAAYRTLTIENTQMDYVVFGKGETTLLILPGLSDGMQHVGSSPKTLAFYYRKYARQYTVYVCSRKDDLPIGYTTRDMAEDTAFLMASLGITKAHIMGVSMGGMIAQHLASDFPSRVEKLVIAVSTSQSDKLLQYVVSQWMKMVEEGRYHDFIIDTMERTYTNRYLRKFRPFYFMLKKAGKPRSVPHFLRQAEACFHHNVYNHLPAITCPVLIVGGGMDEIVGPQASKRIAEQIKGCQLRIYPVLGHGAFQESKPFSHDVMQFLNPDSSIL